VWAPLNRHTDQVKSVAFTRGGRRLVGATDDCTSPRRRRKPAPPNVYSKLSTNAPGIGYQAVCHGAARPTRCRIETLYILLIALEPDNEVRPSRALSRPLL